MIKQVFPVQDYWKVVVFYNVNYHFFDDVEKELLLAGISEPLLQELWDSMYYGKAKAVTYSNMGKHVSIVIFNRHESKEDYLNSIVHEAEHVKQAMLNAYQVEDMDEPPAYTIGYLVMKMYEVFKILICDRCSN